MLDILAYSIVPTALFGYLLNKYYFNGPSCKSKNTLYSKVVIITGANCGIGYETALDLARRGATVILACRDLNKAKNAADKIQHESKNMNVFSEKLDLASLKSIKEFVEKFKSKFNRLDVLINNAGLYTSSYKETLDGFEMNFGVMHLGHFYLTNLLLDLLKKSSPSRIINVSSLGHKNTKMRWDDLNFKQNYSGFSAYRQAKLANILFTIELARRYKNDGITSVSLHPGTVRTELIRDLDAKFELKALVYYILVKPMILLIGKDCKQGAQTTIHCAVADEIPQLNGKYFSDCKVAKSSPESQDIDSAKRLWDLSEKLVGLN